MHLRFLHFDFSDTDDGSGCFDAMATVADAQWPALQAELATVLGWAGQAFARGPGPLDDDHDWDCELQATQERSSAHRLLFDAASGRFSEQALPEPPALRRTVSLTLTGTAHFCEALRTRFGLDEPD